jgi:hypothetical protein
VVEVGATKIFARLDGEKQLLAYEMAFAATSDLAMVLPLPVPPSPAADAVQFIDLSGYAAIFTHIENLFPEDLAISGWAVPEVRAQRSTLEVHEVGDFVASFVPRLGDFGRLDRRFRVSDRVWSELPQYRDYGFAVFQLKAGGDGGFLSRLFGTGVTARKVHPMVLCFPTRDPASLFYPTVHVHDGRVKKRAHFDHSLYCQTAEAPKLQIGGFSRAHLRVADCVDVDRTRGLVDRSLPMFRMQILGEIDNADLVARLAG